MKRLLLLILFSSLYFTSFSQFYYQYFDGADTSYLYSIIIETDSSSSNIWQIGEPQKNIFNAAGTFPNVIVTDTVNPYPINNTSSFEFGVARTPWGFGGILALQWVQKLDMDHGLDGGLVEISLDTGATWSNVVNSPYTYNFYGFQAGNLDTLTNGEYAFTGTDSSWANVWLCYDLNWLSTMDSVMLKYTFVSDSLNSNKEGWMIDNFMGSTTLVHTVQELDQEEYLKVEPTLTSGRVNIHAKIIDEFHIIESIQLINVEGRIVQEYGVVPTKFYVDIDHHPNGVYLLRINTNLKSETFKLILQHE